ncbi:MAG TPA: 2OG-Fe(II) oxygenase, partial [Acidimicrobiales bacterium]
APIANRCVVFSTTDYSFHGHPEPVTCPPGRTRRSLALYYYSNGRPADEVSPSRTTAFQPRPGDQWRRPDSRGNRAERWLPPAVLDAARAARRRGLRARQG